MKLSPFDLLVKDLVETRAPYRGEVGDPAGNRVRVLDLSADG